MILSFNIEYRTNWGEEVRISGLFPESIPLHTTDGIYWTAELELEVPQEGMTINYSYQIEQNGIVIRKEWDSFSRSIFLSGSSRKIYRINDCWKNIPEQLYLYSSAFTEALLAHPEKENIPQRYKKGLVIKAYAPRINKDYCLAICGNQKSLGHWDPEKAVLMSDTNFPEWQIELDASKLKYPLEYKFILYNKQEKKADCWEKNPNRYLADPELKTNETLVISDRYVYFDIPAWKGAGIAIPVFSLKSEKSFGVGDFGDLKRMVDWAVNTRQKVIQILPVNDTTMTHAWTDSYPYNSISIYAFHPMYADIRQMGTLKDKEAASKFSKKQKELNSLPAIDYEAVNQTKWEFFNLLFRQEGEKVLASKDFKDFFETNKEWLQPYAVFSYLRDAYKTPNFRKWPRHSVYQAEDIEKMCQPGTADYPHISLYYYIQYHLHLQLLSATEYARQHGVVLKGDIPIGISRNSVEAWTEPHYFNLDGQAGAPPDDFSINGQNWGFPTYNWEEMSKDGFAWWKSRFRKMAEYFDAYRIDHVLGFFRIWQIPMDAVHGLLGYFNPALPFSESELRYNYDFWIDPDLQTTPYIMDYFVEDFFGPYTKEALDTFCRSVGGGRYKLKAEYDTQRKVVDHFASLPKDEKNTRICDGLLGLIDQVLFIEDPIEKGKYHPRISAQYTYTYRSLNDYERWCFNRLYNDFFYHRHNEFWYDKAMWKLPPLIDSTDMLVCAEDLGMIPACVPAVMHRLEILSLEIQRMPKDPATPFGDTWRYPYYSVCTTSTHDMGGIRQWWEEDRAKTQQFFNEVLHEHGAAPYFAEPWICDRIIDLHLASPSMLCILPLQDWLSINGNIRREKPAEEQINVPANPRHYWRYRMHMTLGELLGHTEFSDYLRNKISNTGR